MKKIRVALVHNIISPYRIPVFNELAKRNDIDLTVLFLSESARDRKWNTDIYKKQMHFQYKVLNNVKIIFPLKEPVEYTINLSIFNELKNGKYDVVITSGWTDFACQIVPIFKSVFKYKFILWAGSTKDEPSLQRFLTLPLVKFIVRSADHIVAYGTKAKDYLISLGSPAEKISLSLNSVDVAHFKKRIQLLKKQKTKQIRKKYSIAENQRVILYVGQFIERKNVEVLILATSELNLEEISLVLLGYGPRKKNYIKLAKKLGINLKIINHVELDKIPNIYKLSDVLVLPSTEEVWGLVVNEAMASGLPVVVSSKVGSAKDLVIDNENGFVFDPGSVSELAEKLKTLLENKTLRIKMGNDSRKIISNITPQVAANVLYNSLKTVI